MQRRPWIALPLVGFALLISGCGGMDWSPDGTKIVTAWQSGADHTVLGVVDLRTGVSRALPGSGDAMNPRWSPDGRWIAFNRWVGGSPIAHVHDLLTGKTAAMGVRDCSTFVWREDSARLLVCTNEAALCYAIPDLAPTWEAKLPPQTSAVVTGAWIPDTDAVALLASNDLWLIEGAEVSRLTTTGDVLGFGIRPGAKELIWARASRNPRYILLSLYAMPIKERSARRLPMPYRVAEINPSPRAPITAVGPVSFSPDGRHMAVTCVYVPAGRKKGTESARVFVMDLNGRNARLPYPEKLGQPLLPVGPTSFSPDARRLSLTIGTQETARLWVCNADGTGGRIVMTTSLSQKTR